MRILWVHLLSFALAYALPAQQSAPQTQAGQPAAQKSISAQLGLHAFPAKDQNREQQQKDELACYNWAQQDSGFDPLAALTALQSAKNSSATTAPPSNAAQGAGVRGAARGAAGGAAIGAIAGDAGKGAAIGATAGGLRGKMAQKKAQAEAQQRQQQQAQQQTQQQAQTKVKTQAGFDDFKKAYSACMEAKNYSVK